MHETILVFSYLSQQRRTDRKAINHIPVGSVVVGSVNNYAEICLQALLGEFSRRGRKVRLAPPDASCSCTSCCPIASLPHAAAGRRPASEPSSRPGSVNNYAEICLQALLGEFSRRGRKVRLAPPDASCSCTSCCPIASLPHAAAGRRPASELSSRPGSSQPPASCAGFPD